MDRLTKYMRVSNMTNESITADNSKIQCKKRRALRGKQRVELLIHPVEHSSYGVSNVVKRTVVHLDPSFFYFWLYTGWLKCALHICPPFFVIGNPLRFEQTAQPTQ